MRAVCCGALSREWHRAAKVWRIGFLAGAPREANLRNYASFVEGMRELGYVENRDFMIETRSANEQYERFPDLARELIRLKVDVIVTAAGSGGPQFAGRDHHDSDSLGLFD